MAASSFFQVSSMLHRDHAHDGVRPNDTPDQLYFTEQP